MREIIPGYTFGQWTVIEELAAKAYADKRSPDSPIMIRQFLCRCSCGREGNIPLTNIDKTMRCRFCVDRTRFTDQDIRDIRAKALLGWSVEDLAKAYARTERTMASIVAGNSYKDVAP